MTSLLDADPLLLLRTVLGVAVMVLAVMVVLRGAGVSLGAQPVLAIGRAIGQLAIASLVLSGVLSVPWTAVRRRSSPSSRWGWWRSAHAMPSRSGGSSSATP